MQSNVVTPSIGFSTIKHLPSEWYLDEILFLAMPKGKGKMPKRFPAARSGDAIRVSAKDGESTAQPRERDLLMQTARERGADVLLISIRLESTAKSAFTWLKRFQAMVALMRT